MKLSKCCIVRGRVQGVFFRATTRQQAMAANLGGYAKNLADGSVEVFLSGEQDTVETLCEWLWQGPPMAEVSQVECEIVEYVPLHEFQAL